jgi:hypothetical protein
MRRAVFIAVLLTIRGFPRGDYGAGSLTCPTAEDGSPALDSAQAGTRESSSCPQHQNATRCA